MKLLPLCEFYVRRLFQAQPVGISGLFISMVLAAGACYAFLHWDKQHQELTQQWRAAQSLGARSSPLAVVQATNTVDLPAFFSAEFTEQFTTIAREANLPTDEVFYALEAGPNQPFWRYRITVDVKTGYPELRKFIAALAAALPNVALDTIRCHRENAEDVRLSCQLAFSAFFRKAARG